MNHRRLWLAGNVAGGRRTEGKDAKFWYENQVQSGERDELQGTVKIKRLRIVPDSESFSLLNVLLIS